MRFKDETMKELLELKYQLRELKKDFVELSKKYDIIRIEHKEQIKTLTTKQLVEQSKDISQLNPLEELNKARYTFDESAPEFEADILSGSV